jgi:hypothetical protein
LCEEGPEIRISKGAILKEKKTSQSQKIILTELTVGRMKWTPL